MQKTIAAVFLALVFSVVAAMAAQMEATVLELDRGKGRMLVMTTEGEKSLKLGDSVVGMEHIKQGAKVLIVYSEFQGTINVSEIIVR